MRLTSRAGSALLAVAFVVLGHGLARAQPTAPSEAALDPTTEEARALFEEGRALADARRFREAAAAFERSLALAPRPSTRFNLAVTQYTLGHYVEAVLSLERYLEETSASDPLEAEGRADAQRMLTHAQRSVGRLALEVMPASATVTVDGAPVEGGAARLARVDEGTHVIRAEAEGHVSALLEVSVRAGQEVRRAIQLASGQVPGRLAIDVPTSPTAEISVDGRRVGVGRAEVTVEAGSHTVRVSHPDLEPLERTLELAWNERFELVLAPTPRGRSLLEEPAFWGTAAGLVAVAALSVVLGVVLSEEPTPHGGTTGVVLRPGPAPQPGIAP